MFAQNKIVIELKNPATVGVPVSVKFKRYKNGKLKRIKEKSLTVKVSAGKYTNGHIVSPYNSDNLDNHQLKVVYNWANQPDVWYDTLINVGYTGNVMADYSGRHGNDGRKAGGRTGLLVIGRDGYDGKDGANGEDGENGEGIEVKLDAYYDSLLHVDLLRAKVKTKPSLTTKTYLINTENGKFIIRSNGGDGGHGGRGGRGGEGKDGRAATDDKKAKSSGDGGDGGRGGDGGNGGDTGFITILVDPSSIKYLEIVKTQNLHGRKGRGGDSGKSGAGGNGGNDCPDGSDGSDGSHGLSGKDGINYGKAKIIYLKNKDL